jgi:integrase/recombinase XerD
LTISDYIIAMKREVNPRFTYKRYTIQILSELSKAVGIEKKFIDMTREDILYYLDNCRKSESEDPLHKWIASYNLRLELSELSPEMTIETDLENKWNNH